MLRYSLLITFFSILYAVIVTRRKIMLTQAAEILVRPLYLDRERGYIQI